MVGVVATSSTKEMEQEPSLCNLSLAIDCTLSLGSSPSRPVEAPTSRLSRAGSPDPDLALSLSVRSEQADHASRRPALDTERSDQDMSWGSSCIHSDSDATPEYYPQVPERDARDDGARRSFQAWPRSSAQSSYDDGVTTFKTLVTAIDDEKHRNRAGHQPWVANYLPSIPLAEAKALEQCITQEGDSCARVCAHCGTSKTPLWRNGPGGPKSLCNACGIRFKKAGRRSAANGGADLPSSPPPAVTKVGKRKLVVEDEEQRCWVFPAKPRKRSRATAPPVRTSDSILSGSCMTFQSSLVYSPKSPLQRDFPSSPPSESEEKKGSVLSDEQEGAKLLMELSCGRLNR